ncbi:hypothetical protein NK6_7031 [Bradyrhizobium diazoefficiens]|uniref:Uncharacterized protein n=1 Tax=Bradyrhizobium diazoefficiens TaxID=1355477 RepID=A0A0E4BUD7_9BRAD|nr:hypothetical protein NK6_7031 [Bradyrhizobium diazoefficiens]
MPKHGKSQPPGMAQSLMNRHLWRPGFEPDTGSKH